MNFADAEKIATAVLYEGYILYPYRPTSTKNVQRWNFGTLYPRDYAEAQRPTESFCLSTECLLKVGADAKLDVRVRFIQLARRQAASPQEWEEGMERSVDLKDLVLDRMAAEPVSHGFSFYETPAVANSAPEEPLEQNQLCCTQIQTCHPDRSDRRERSGGTCISLPGYTNTDFALVQKDIYGRLEIHLEPLSSGLSKLSLKLLNITPLENAAECSRKDAMLQTFASAHVLLGITGGEFISLLDMPEEFREAAAGCSNTNAFPVLVGAEGQRTMMLCSPIILYDYPQIAPESAGDFFDGTEMDEMLALRVLTLTDEEKREMRNGDDRARRILERTEALPQDFLTKIHGAIRGMRPVAGNPASDTSGPEEIQMHGDWDPFAERPALESVRVFGTELRAGDRVRLWPQKKADIMDMALEGKVALIEAIEQDLEDQIQLAVVLDDDPGREFGMMRQPGHRFFFSSEEIEPLQPAEGPEKA